MSIPLNVFSENNIAPNGSIKSRLIFIPQMQTWENGFTACVKLPAYKQAEPFLWLNGSYIKLGKCLLVGLDCRDSVMDVL